MADGPGYRAAFREYESRFMNWPSRKVARILSVDCPFELDGRRRMCRPRSAGGVHNLYGGDTTQNKLNRLGEFEELLNRIIQSAPAQPSVPEDHPG